MEHTVNTVHKFNLTRGVPQKSKNIYFIVFMSLIDLLIPPEKHGKWHFESPKSKKISESIPLSDCFTTPSCAYLTGKTTLRPS